MIRTVPNQEQEPNLEKKGLIRLVFARRKFVGSIAYMGMSHGYKYVSSGPGRDERGCFDSFASCTSYSEPAFELTHIDGSKETVVGNAASNWKNWLCRLAAKAGEIMKERKGVYYQPEEPKSTIPFWDFLLAKIMGWNK